MIYVRHIGFSLLVSLFLMAPACAEEALRYAGATTLQRFFMPDAARLFSDETAVRIRIEGGNTGPGITALLKGEVDMAGAGRHLTDEEKRLGLVEHFLGWDVLAIVVNQQNPVEDLTLGQLQTVFSGTVTNWQELGGEDKKIVVVTAPKGSGIRSAVKKLILKDKDFPSREIVSAIVAESDQQVGLFSGGITAMSRSMLDAPKVKAVTVSGVEPTASNISKGEYSLAKPLALITRGEPKDELARFLELVKSSRGKAILNKRFVAAE